MSDAIIISLILVGASNALLTLYLIYLVKFDKEVSQRALTLIKARYSTEQILQDMSIIISETTERFEEQTRKVQEQVNRHLQHANLTSSKLNSTLVAIADDISQSSKNFGYVSDFKTVEQLDTVVSNITKVEKEPNYSEMMSFIEDELISESILVDDSFSSIDDEFEMIHNMFDSGMSIIDIANKLNIKEKKVKVILNSTKVMNM